MVVIPRREVRNYLLDRLLAVERTAQAFVLEEDFLLDLREEFSRPSTISASMRKRRPLRRSVREEFIRYDEAAIANYN